MSRGDSCDGVCQPWARSDDHHAELATRSRIAGRSKNRRSFVACGYKGDLWMVEQGVIQRSDGAAWEPKDCVDARPEEYINENVSRPPHWDVTCKHTQRRLFTAREPSLHLSSP